ncbi:MAG: S9 family peptidase [Sedimentisphaerales bacterium]|nr:S9 family peptidase [Sedimentisphaerales bacterium]
MKTKHLSALVLSVTLLAVLPACSPGQTTHPFTVHDMLAMDRISDPQLSPQGDAIVFVRRSTDLEGNAGKTDLWRVAADGGNLSRLTTHEAADRNPCWSADGKHVYFISGRGGSDQVWQLPVAGGEARQITDLPLDVDNLVLSPDGKTLAFTMEVFPGKTAEQTAGALKEIAARKAGGRIYEKLFIRHWDTWEDGRRCHLFAMAIGQATPPVDVMKDMDADTPSRPFGGPEEITFTPDGQGLVFTARNAGRTEAWSTNFDLYVAPIDGAEGPRCLTGNNPAWDSQPLFSPDGKTLAYLAMRRPGYEADRMRIILRDWESGRDRILTEEWDRSVEGFCFSPDGGVLYATAANLGQKSLFAIELATGRVRTLVEEGSLSVIAAAGNQVFYTRNSLQSAAEIYAAEATGRGSRGSRGSRDSRAITQINRDKLAACRMGDYEQFTFAGWNNETVYGYVVRPIDFDATRSYPVAFLIHGGPQGSFGNTFHYRWNPQVYAGAGYAAVMIDFHGSTGYGQAFCDSIRGDWGGKPLVDLQKGLAAALKRYPYLDGDRVGALGASFGGYMINWIAGNWPDRFGCLVNHDGNLDERMAYFDTEELWFPEWDHVGTPWDHPEQYEKHNPINYVQHWQTPMLVIHGGRDFRVADTQGIATFTALQRRGIPSKLLYFPEENHWILKPHNSILWHETVLDWLDQWLR